MGKIGPQIISSSIQRKAIDQNISRGIRQRRLLHFPFDLAGQSMTIQSYHMARECGKWIEATSHINDV